MYKPSDAFGATSLIKGGTDETPAPIPLNKGDVAKRHGVYVWQSDETIASGIYLVRARTEDGRTASKRVVYLK